MGFHWGPFVPTRSWAMAVAIFTPARHIQLWITSDLYQRRVVSYHEACNFQLTTTIVACFLARKSRLLAGFRLPRQLCSLQSGGSIDLTGEEVWPCWAA